MNMPVKLGTLAPPELRDRVKASIIISEKPLLNGPEFELRGKAAKTDGMHFYIYSTSPGLFGENGPVPKYLGYVGINEGLVKHIVGDEGAWLKSLGAGDNERVAELRDFYPLEAAGKESEDLGVGGKVLDLILGKLAEEFDWAVVFSTRPKMVQLLESREFHRRGEEDSWAKRL